MIVSSKYKNRKSIKNKKTSSSVSFRDFESASTFNLLINDSVETESDGKSLRPSCLSELVGREKEKEILRNMIESSKVRNTVLDHILLYGPPGLGKTSIAYVLSKEMNSKIVVINGNSVDKVGELASVLTSLSKGDILFIDEIHRLKPTLEEVLYPAMDDRVVDIIVGKGPTSKVIKLSLEEFTLIGATTLPAKLSAPLRDRFGVILKIDYYSDNEIEQVILQKSKILSMAIEDDEALKLLASRSRMTPRIAIRLLKMVRDFSLSDTLHKNVRNGQILLTKEMVSKVLDTLSIYENGLDQTDVLILEALHSYYPGSIGLRTLSSILGEDPGTIEAVNEPFLLRLGYIVKTSKGRSISELGIRYLESIKK